MKQVQFKCASCGGVAASFTEIPAEVTVIGSIRINGKPGARWTCAYCGVTNEVIPASGNLRVCGDIVGGDSIKIYNR